MTDCRSEKELQYGNQWWDIHVNCVSPVTLCRKKKVFHTFENPSDNTLSARCNQRLAKASAILSRFKMADCKRVSAHVYLEET